MQYELQIFHNHERDEVRTVLIDGVPWFVLADVCRAIDLKANNGSYYRHARDLEDDERQTVPREVIEKGPLSASIEGVSNPDDRLVCISESGLYAVSLKSKTEAARRFRKWITAEVLPSIRRTGAYAAPGAGIPIEWRPFHDRLNKAYGAAPDGYFSIFKESADLAVQLITQGVKVDDKTVPDISLGMAWGKHWDKNDFDAVHSPRRRYEHNYPDYFPQAKSNPQHPYCYPESALPEFRRWLREDYMRVGLPKYLNGQVAQRKLEAPLATAVLAAVSGKPSLPKLRGPA